MQSSRLEVLLRSARLRAGLSQGELAERAGVTRQAISAIESGKAVPTTAVALRLARVLGRRVEELFQLVDELPTVEAELLPTDQPLPSGPVRVQVAQVGERILARPLTGPQGIVLSLPRANGLAQGGRAGRARIELFEDPTQLTRTVVAVGCDPAMALLAEHLTRRYPDLGLAWHGGSSTLALEAVARGEAHLAGCHLLDPVSGEYNLPFVRRIVGSRALVVTFAHWEQGLIVAAGNPRGIRGVQDLARPDVRLVNREPGSGARALLEEKLRAARIPPTAVAGYQHVVGSHLAVAEAVAAGLADVGVGVLAAARALGLEFLPLAVERYDLVIPRPFVELAPVQALLETLRSPLFRREVEALGGYDAGRMGDLVSAA